MDSNKLNQMMELIDERAAPVDSVLVVRNGYIVFEEYRNGYDELSSHHLQSVTKSFTSTLVGIAIKEGFIRDTHQRMVDFFPDREIANLDTSKESITLEHLLTMSEGMDWHEVDLPYSHPDNSLGQMWQRSDVIQHVLDTPMVRRPGESWNYNSGTSILLGNIVEESSDQSILMFARQYLFDPLGIDNLYWEKADSRHYHTDGGLYMRPRDMARLGYLMLNDGMWEGEQILPADWVDHASAAHYQTHGPYGYGYQWWTLPQGGIYTALGHYDQAIYVIPAADMVVVFTGNVPDEAIHPEGGLLIRYILGALDDIPEEYAERHYEGFGFSYGYGSDFDMAELPAAGEDRISNEAGVVQFRFISYPVEIFNVSWDESWAGLEPEDIMDRAFDSMCEDERSQISFGKATSVSTANRELTVQHLTLRSDLFPLEGVSTVWECDHSDRAYVLSFVTDHKSTEDDIRTRFSELLDAFSCQGTG